jgi:hypothetical protein
MEAYNQVDVMVRVLTFPSEEPGAAAVIVTTFLNGRMDEREMYNQQGDLIATTGRN